MTTDPSMTVADQVIAGLRASNIDTLFCLPGVQNDDFFNVLVDAPDIRPIVTRHEQGAAYMAMGAAQVTGTPAACCVVPGPGMLNASGALTSAYWGYARVLAIVGQIATFQQGRNFGSLHDLPDQTAILQQLTKESVVVNDAESATAEIRRAFDALHSGTPRPVSIEVPANVWANSAGGEVGSPVATMPEPDATELERAAELLDGAERPMIIVGSGGYGASAEVTALAERIGAVVTTRRMGHGVVPTEHRQFVPISVANELWADVDVVIGIGSRMEWPLGAWGYDDQLKVIQVNTDADELDRRGITTVGLHGDAAEVCRTLLSSLGRGERDVSWAGLDALQERFAERSAHLEPQRGYCAALREVIPDDGAIVEDVTQIGFAAHLFYDHRRPRTFLSSGAAGTLGAGTAVAIGASQATDRPVVGIVGDGGFLFTATELATAAQHNIPCNIVVFNDGAYGNVQRIQRQRFGEDRTIASTLVNPDLEVFTRSFGAQYWHADSAESLIPALGQAIDTDGPCVVEVSVEAMPDPWPFFRLPRVRGA